MLKNLKIGVKLIGIGTCIMLVPLAIVAVLAVTRARAGLISVENEALQGRARDVAQMIDRVFDE
ncbi:MAG TPA: hypothetical protein VFI08_05505, partial [Spirochaetia bacterium]|nr:hypothetical protein [Spirochaetia bacterium]